MSWITTIATTIIGIVALIHQKKIAAIQTFGLLRVNARPSLIVREIEVRAVNASQRKLVCQFVRFRYGKIELFRERPTDGPAKLAEGESFNMFVPIEQIKKELRAIGYSSRNQGFTVAVDVMTIDGRSFSTKFRLGNLRGEAIKKTVANAVATLLALTPTI